ncbi:ATP-grasp fold amidoligase family protein [uncultured Pseudokineococcus sp.]|uniref:ATP-grasp fold amidoligase family protein n=1 Tax=uncultured Pseudokineococcus sp. TaxID=1642928 RepID=UPI002616B01F|nr:ATP-grasp fold amidoligase family protein [uncultured Pseudokineococcus sp.]
MRTATTDETPGGPLAHVGRAVWRAMPVRARRAALYRRAFGRLPDRRRPTTLSEKIDWRALHDRRPRLVTACDKLASKELALDAGVRPARTLWWGTDVRELAHVDLGERWVLKPNHRSGGLVHLGEGEPDVEALERLTRGWLAPSTDELRTGEWGYSGARHVLLAEERLGEPGEDLVDWKVHVLDGEPALVQVHHGRFGDHRVRYYWPDWTPTDVAVRTATLAEVVPPPPHLDALLDAARRLGLGWDYVRADLYDLSGGVRFGELTVYPGSGLTDFRDDPWLDAELGRRWTLPGSGSASTPPRRRG